MKSEFLLYSFHAATNSILRGVKTDIQLMKTQGNYDYIETLVSLVIMKIDSSHGNNSE